jgi:hypothetical protein
MPIRIDCPLEGHRETWVEFRDSGWTFGDRRRILEAMSDAVAVSLILGYVERWSLKDAGGADVPIKRDIEVLDGVDDEVVVWLIRAWFQAREKRSAVPKNS